MSFVFSEKSEQFGAMFCLKSTDSSPVQKVEKATATSQNRPLYRKQMLLTAHDTIMSSWYRLVCVTADERVACASTFSEFRGFRTIVGQYRTDGRSDAGYRHAYLMCCCCFAGRWRWTRSWSCRWTARGLGSSIPR